MKNIPINNNPFGVVMAYVIKNGEDDLIHLFDKYNIPADPTPQNIIAAIKQHGVKFLHELDVTIIRPYSRQMLGEMSNFERADKKRSEAAQLANPTVKDVAQDLGSNQRNPNKGANILAGLGGGLEVLGTVIGTIQTIKGNNHPQPQQQQVVYTNPAPSTSKTDTEDEKAEKNKKIMLWVGGGLIAAVVMLFVFMQLKKK